MEMMLSDNPAQLFQLWCRIEIRTDFPYDFTAFFIQNRQNIRFTAIEYDIIRLKAQISVIVPLIRPQIAHAIHMEIISHTAVTGTHVRITGEDILCGFIKAQLIKMIGN